MDKYHKLGIAEDPRKAVYSSSQLVAPHVPGGSWQALGRQVSGEDVFAGSRYTLAGTFLHAMIFEDAVPVVLDENVATWTATGLGAKGNLTREISLEGTARLGSWLIPPPADVMKEASTLIGIEQRKKLEQLASELGLELAGAEIGLLAARHAYDEAVAVDGWINGDDPIPPMSAIEARSILLGAPGGREKEFYREHLGLKFRAKPDLLTSDTVRTKDLYTSAKLGTIVDLKVLRNGNAWPDRFWRWADDHRAWERLAFYEWVCGDSTGISNRPWTVATIDPEAPAAFVYPCPENRQAHWRLKMHEDLELLRDRIEHGWHHPYEDLMVQPAPESVHWYRADYGVVTDIEVDEPEPDWGDVPE